MVHLQAAYKLAENDVLVKTRKVDQGIVKECLEEAKQKYKDLFGQDAPTMKLNEKDFLPPPPSSAANVDEEDNWCAFLHPTPPPPPLPSHTLSSHMHNFATCHSSMSEGTFTYIVYVSAIMVLNY